MSKTNIRDIVTKPVSVTSPDQSPERKSMGGKEFMSGSPAGREARPNPVRKGFKMPGSK